MRTYLISAAALAVLTGLTTIGASAAPAALSKGVPQAAAPTVEVAMSSHDRMMMKRKRMMMMKKKRSMSRGM